MHNADYSMRCYVTISLTIDVILINAILPALVVDNAVIVFMFLNEYSIENHYIFIVATMLFIIPREISKFLLLLYDYLLHFLLL